MNTLLLISCWIFATYMLAGWAIRYEKKRKKVPKRLGFEQKNAYI